MLSFEEMLKEFLEHPNYNKYKSESYCNFSNGKNMSRWFLKNRDFIFSSEDEMCKNILMQYKEYLDIIGKKHEARKKSEFTITFEFSYLYKEFRNCSNIKKFESNSDVKFNNGMLMGRWFRLNKQRLFSGKSPIYVEIQEQYKNKIYDEKMKEKVENSKKKQYFLKTKGFEKFSSYFDLQFYDEQKLYDWFERNKDFILSSDYEVDISIKNQYYEYCYFLELEEMFLKANEEKFDEYGNIRFWSGALMYDWFITHLNYIKNSGEEIDKEIMLHYKNYLDKNKKYKDDEKDLVKIKKY